LGSRGFVYYALGISHVLVALKISFYLGEIMFDVGEAFLIVFIDFQVVGERLKVVMSLWVENDT
jgi:hypothetical protein